MKKIIFLLLSVCLFAACSKDDDAKDPDLVFMTISGDSLEPRTVEMVESLIVSFDLDSVKYTKINSQVTIADKVVHFSACAGGIGDGEFPLAGTKYSNVVKMVKCEPGKEDYNFTATEYVVKEGSMKIEHREGGLDALITLDLVAESKAGASIKMKGQMIAIY